MHAKSFVCESDKNELKECSYRCNVEGAPRDFQKHGRTAVSDQIQVRSHLTEVKSVLHREAKSLPFHSHRHALYSSVALQIDP